MSGAKEFQRFKRKFSLGVLKSEAEVHSAYCLLAFCHVTVATGLTLTEQTTTSTFPTCNLLEHTGYCMSWFFLNLIR